MLGSAMMQKVEKGSAPAGSIPALPYVDVQRSKDREAKALQVTAWACKH